MKYRLKKITTENFIFINNNLKNVEYSISPLLGKSIKKVNDTLYQLTLSFRLHSDEARKAPYEIELDVSGYFELIDFNSNDTKEFLNKNAVAILFPYLRSILSSSMASLMVQPIILPIVDASNLLDKMQK